MRNVIVLALLFSIGCDSEVLQDTDTDDGARIQFILGGLDEAPESSDPFELRAAWFEGSNLKVTASYSGGCKEHTFKLYSSDQITKSFPPGVAMAIVHDAHEDGCEAYITETFDVDLSPLVESLNGPFWADLRIAGSNESLRITYPAS